MTQFFQLGQCGFHNVLKCRAMCWSQYIPYRWIPPEIGDAQTWTLEYDHLCRVVPKVDNSQYSWFFVFHSLERWVVCSAEDPGWDVLLCFLNWVVARTPHVSFVEYKEAWALCAVCCAYSCWGFSLYVEFFSLNLHRPYSYSVSHTWSRRQICTKCLLNLDLKQILYHSFFVCCNIIAVTSNSCRNFSEVKVVMWYGFTESSNSTSALVSVCGNWEVVCVLAPL